MRNAGSMLNVTRPRVTGIRRAAKDPAKFRAPPGTSAISHSPMPRSPAMTTLTAGPARVLNRPDLCSGTLQPGSPADVTIFDPQAEWVVDTAKFVSKGKNTPLEGATLRGRVVVTIVDGRVVYEDEAVKVG